MSAFLDLLLLKDYNSRIVILALIVYGIGGGIVGVYMMLSKRSMIADAFSHATLPGIVIAFLISTMLGNYEYKNIWVLLLGAAISTFVALLVILLFQTYTFLKQDAIFGIIISLFFGIGIVLMSITNKVNSASASGLSSYIYGNPTSLQRMDAYFFLFCSLFILCFVLLYRRKLLVICFDPHYGSVIGISVKRIDFVLLSLTLLQTIVGIQAMGIILASAILIVPPVSARFWSDKLSTIQLLSVLFCVISVIIGGAASSLYTKLPAGASIIIVAEIFFLLSLFFGYKQGLVRKMHTQFQFRVKIMRQHMLRKMYEFFSIHNMDTQQGQLEASKLQKLSGLSNLSFYLMLRFLKNRGLVSVIYNQVSFSERGYAEARQFVKNHRLWELYLLKNTHVGVEEIDFSADTVEHVIGREYADELEQMLLPKNVKEMVKSPHKIRESDGNLE